MLRADITRFYFYDHLLKPLTFTEGSTTYESLTGSQLQNKTLTIQDTGFYINLQSDGSLSGYGFRFASIIPLYPEDPVVILYTCEQSSATRARLTYNVTGADGYRISRSSSESGTYIYARTSLDVFSEIYDLTPGQLYWFKVRPYYVADGVNHYLDYSNAMSVRIMATPAMISVVASSGNRAYIRWSAVDNAQGYVLYRSTEVGGPYIYRCTVSRTECLDYDLSPNTDYFYKVKAYRAYSTKVYSALSDASNAVRLEGPVISSVRQYTAAGALITWAAVPGASGYQVFRSTEADGIYVYQKTVLGTSLINTGLTPGSEYFYKVRYYIDLSGIKQYSANSDAVSLRLLSVPVITTATAASGSSVYIAWQAVEGADGYRLFRSTSAAGTYSYVKTILSLSWLDNGLISGATYYYKIDAYRLYGSVKVFSYKSSAAAVTTTSAPYYRALLIGQSNYISLSDLHGAEDAANVSSLLANLDMDGKKYITTKKTNQTAAQILSAIPAAFAGAGSNDISLFYYSGHGDNSTSETAGSLAGIDSAPVLPSALRSALDQVPGTIIVLIDSCGSGSYIYSRSLSRVLEDTSAKVNPLAFTNAIISAFSGSMARTGELLTSKYVVLTASEYGEVSWETPEGGMFTNAMCKSGGWDPVSHTVLNLLGDSNSDSIVTLQEGYTYILNNINPYYQVVQIYPSGSVFPLFTR